jgi:hypothetical protein
MRRLFLLLALVLCVSLSPPGQGPAWGYDDLVLPTVEFTAISVHKAGAFESQETIHYANGKLRIEHGNGFSTTILDLKTQTQCLLMVNHTYLVTPMDDELFRHYIARTVDMSGARRLRTDHIDGVEATKYAFGEDGELDAAGSYWLTKTGIMIRRDYDDGVFGQNVHHLEFLTHLTIEKQSAALFSIPPGYKPAK